MSNFNKLLTLAENEVKRRDERIAELEEVLREASQAIGEIEWPLIRENAIPLLLLKQIHIKIHAALEQGKELTMLKGVYLLDGKKILEFTAIRLWTRGGKLFKNYQPGALPELLSGIVQYPDGHPDSTSEEIWFPVSNIMIAGQWDYIAGAIEKLHPYQPGKNEVFEIGRPVNVTSYHVAYVWCGENVADEIAALDYVTAVVKYRRDYRVIFNTHRNDIDLIRRAFPEQVNHIAAWLQAQQEN